jgi:gamma-glutamyl hercynylcysteine S-oxide hydrolase
MCRHLAYVGPPVALRWLLFDAPHALVHQARAPKLQTAGPDNPHGWGVAWDPPFGWYRTDTPMWQDTTFTSSDDATAVIAAARFASVGSTLDMGNAAPFVWGPWKFSLNGYVAGFREGFGDELRSQISPKFANLIEGDTDSEVLFALVGERLNDGAAPGEALADVVRIVRERSDGALNLLLTDGETIAATALENSLFLRRGDGMLVASEPLDDDDSWIEVDNGSLVENDRVTPIGGLS